MQEKVTFDPFSRDLFEKYVAFVQGQGGAVPTNTSEMELCIMSGIKGYFNWKAVNEVFSAILAKPASENGAIDPEQAVEVVRSRANSPTLCCNTLVIFPTPERHQTRDLWIVSPSQSKEGPSRSHLSAWIDDKSLVLYEQQLCHEVLYKGR